jgi:exodeoxyribonuclease V alpha subunit
VPGEHRLAQHVAVLVRSYRFDAEGGIGALSRSINAGDARKVLALLADERQKAIVLRPLSAWAAYAPQLEKEIMAALGPLFDCDDPATAFALLNRFKILSAVRKGPFGVESMNILVEQILRRNGRIPLFPSSADGYPSRPVMITRNDYFHGLFNGDVGVTMRRAAGGVDDLQVVFPGSDGGVKRLAPQQLPEHETVYAMTIHKSQGSEFEDVMIVLPDEDSPLLTRELIYTAVTRARRSITLWAEPALLAKAVERPIERSSGLKDALWPSYWSAEKSISR